MVHIDVRASCSCYRLLAANPWCKTVPPYPRRCTIELSMVFKCSKLIVIFRNQSEINSALWHELLPFCRIKSAYTVVIKPWTWSAVIFRDVVKPEPLIWSYFSYFCLSVSLKTLSQYITILSHSTFQVSNRTSLVSYRARVAKGWKNSSNFQTFPWELCLRNFVNITILI